MKNTISLKKIVLFICVLICITIAKQFTVDYLKTIEITEYKTHLLIKSFFNIILATFSYLMIKSNHLSKLSGLSNIKPQKIHLLIIGASYVILLNFLFSDNLTNYFITNILTLLIYCISIGFAEELSIRGYLQSSLSNYFNNPIKAIYIASFIFGIIHLIRFDKGVYGEISQVFFAAFIGIMFGALLLIIKRLYPLIIAHAAIDFFAKIDKVGLDFNTTNIDPGSITNAVLVIILISPCLFYGLFLIKKHIKKNIQTNSIKAS